MNIIELVKIAKDGKTLVKRPNYDIGHNTIYWSEEKRSFMISGLNVVYRMSISDLTATDWYIVKNKTAFEKYVDSVYKAEKREDLWWYDTAKNAWNASLEALKEEIGEELSGLLIMKEIEELKVKE